MKILINIKCAQIIEYIYLKNPHINIIILIVKMNMFKEINYYTLLVKLILGKY